MHKSITIARSTDTNAEESSEPDVLPFPRADDETSSRVASATEVQSTDEVITNVLDAVENVSRRMNDLARQLNCLGYFDDDPDHPRAA